MTVVNVSTRTHSSRAPEALYIQPTQEMGAQLDGLIRDGAVFSKTASSLILTEAVFLVRPMTLHWDTEKATVLEVLLTMPVLDNSTLKESKEIKNKSALVTVKVERQESRVHASAHARESYGFTPSRYCDRGIVRLGY